LTKRHKSAIAAVTAKMVHLSLDTFTKEASVREELKKETTESTKKLDVTVERVKLELARLAFRPSCVFQC